MRLWAEELRSVEDVGFVFFRILGSVESGEGEVGHGLIDGCCDGLILIPMCPV